MAKKIHKRKKDGCADERAEYLSNKREGHAMVCTDTRRSFYTCIRCDRRALIYAQASVVGMSSDPCPYGEV